MPTGDRTVPSGWICPECGGELVVSDQHGYYGCHRSECTGYRTLEATSHAVDRYTQRTADFRVGLLEAFERGVQLDPTHDIVGDEVRYDHPSRTVIVRKDIGITTAMDATIARPAIKYAAIRTCVLELESPKATGQLCAESGVTASEFKELTSDLRDGDGGARSGSGSGQTATRNHYSDRSASGESS